MLTPSSQTVVENAARCYGNGKLVCGKCECYDGWWELHSDHSTHVRKETWFDTRFSGCFSPSGWVRFVTAQRVLQPWWRASVSAQAWKSLARAEETAWNVEPVCATTQNSLKDPTVNMTRPSVRDLEASFATVPAIEWSKSLFINRMLPA